MGFHGLRHTNLCLGYIFFPRKDLYKVQVLSVVSEMKTITPLKLCIDNN